MSGKLRSYQGTHKGSPHKCHKMAKNNFTWHKVSEKEKKEIKKQAKRLLDDFASKLGKIKLKEKHFENNSGIREEGDGWDTDKKFRDIMFSNASFVEDDFIVAEKGGWKLKRIK